MFSFSFKIAQFFILLITIQVIESAVQHVNCSNGTQSNCILLPDECKTGDISKCKYIAKYTPMMNLSPMTVRIELETKIDDQTKGQYIAMGLSYDDEMGSDSVMACVLPVNSNKPTVALSYNNGNENMPMPNSNAVTLVDSGILDGNIICVFDRSTEFSDEKTFPIANASYFLLFARGNPISNGSTNLMAHSLNHHDANFPMVSHQKFVFLGNKSAKNFGSVSIFVFFFFSLLFFY